MRNQVKERVRRYSDAFEFLHSFLKAVTLAGSSCSFHDSTSVKFGKFWVLRSFKIKIYSGRILTAWIAVVIGKKMMVETKDNVTTAFVIDT
jgi:hypothetical protein